MNPASLAAILGTIAAILTILTFLAGVIPDQEVQDAPIPVPLPVPEIIEPERPNLPIRGFLDRFIDYRSRALEAANVTDCLSDLDRWVDNFILTESLEDEMLFFEDGTCGMKYVRYT
ncbi:MAG: hypothetical protein V3U49_02440 [Nitrososphaerales archaeon]